nr:MAG TPA: Sugar transporter SemiSWEET, transporter, SemiSWEET, TRANSPORT PROTEIN.78A [Caudoviricetes sp.]
MLPILHISFSFYFLLVVVCSLWLHYSLVTLLCQYIFVTLRNFFIDFCIMMMYYNIRRR